MRFTLLLIACSFTTISSYTQPIDTFITKVNNSFRGLSVPSNEVAWVSGTRGTVGRTTDAGRTWTFSAVKGFEKTDFRDIHATDAMNAVIIGIDSPGVVLRTKDGGQNWTTIYRDDTKGVFLDAMDVNKKGKGIIVGDPINNEAYVLKIDMNKDEVKRKKVKFNLNEGEAFFAASGTNIQMLEDDDDDHVFVTGGKSSRIGIEDKMSALPMIQGKETTGANSIAVWKEKNMVVVGGDFGNDKDTTANCFYSTNEGKTWNRPTTPPAGYRSCVIYITKDKLIACGTSGVDISEDGGRNWKQISKDSYHVVQKARNGNAVYLAGGRGRIARLF